MKILFIAYRVPFPPISGERLRIFQLLQLLQNKHEIFLITFVTSEDEIQKIRELENIGIQVRYVFLNTVYAKAKALFSLFLFSKLPIQVLIYSNQKMRKAITQLIRDENIDLTYTFLARMGQYCLPNSSVVQILDYMDAFSEYYYSRALINKNFFLGFVDKIEGNRLKNWEQELLTKYDATTIVSKFDSSIISKAFSPIVIPTHVDDFLNFNPSRRTLMTSPSIIFFGEMSTYYSESAVLYTVNQILPIVWQHIPELKLYLVGSNPTIKIINLANERVIVTGFVDDIREYIASADISIVPVLMGSGLKNKIIQSMALRVPIITTSIANVGIHAQHQKHLLIANSPEDFAKSILFLLNNNQERKKMVAQAFDFVKENFGIEIVLEKIDLAFEKALKNVRHNSVTGNKKQINENG